MFDNQGRICRSFYRMVNVLTISENSRYVFMNQGKMKQLKQQIALIPKEFFFTFNSK